MPEDKKVTDVFGIAAYGDALNTVAKGAVDGAGAFLSRICLPAAEEFGLLLRDKISAWRARNAVGIVLKAERQLEAISGPEGRYAHPRIVMRVLEDGSWSDDETIQKMWAGLLVTACTSSGTDESNLMFVQILSQLTSSQVRILNFACTNAPKHQSKAGWLYCGEFYCAIAKLEEISGVSDSHRLDRELDHLRGLQLLSMASGFDPSKVERSANLSPTTLGLQLYARCNGHTDQPEAFFQIVPGGEEEYN